MSFEGLQLAKDELMGGLHRGPLLSTYPHFQKRVDVAGGFEGRFDGFFQKWRARLCRFVDRGEKFVSESRVSHGQCVFGSSRRGADSEAVDLDEVDGGIFGLQLCFDQLQELCVRSGLVATSGHTYV